MTLIPPKTTKVGPKRIAIVGSRRRNSAADYQKLLDAFAEVYQSGDMIVSGGCPRGADRFAELIAKTQQIPILIWYAAWDRFPTVAGFLRNSEIVDCADVVLALVAEDRTGGTEDTIKKAAKAEKKIWIIR